jgi:hypothetical protein
MPQRTLTGIRFHASIESESPSQIKQSKRMAIQNRGSQRPSLRRLAMLGFGHKENPGNLKTE